MDSKIDQIISSDEAIYKYDEAYQEQLLKDRPWLKE